MDAERTDYAVDDEPTYPGVDHELVTTRQVTAALATVLQNALPVHAALVIAGPRAIATLIAGGSILTDDDLGAASLRDAFGLASDDAALGAALERLIASSGVEHAVARDLTGAVHGIVAVLPRRSATHQRTHETLSRAAAALTAWFTVQQRLPARALLDAISDPALVHQDGIVLLASAALGRMLGVTPEHLIGRTLAELTPVLPPYPRECGLVLGGQVRRVLVFRGSATAPRAPVGPCVSRAIAEVYPTVRPWTRIVDDVTIDAAVACAEPALVELIGLATLDVAAGLHGGGAVDRLRISAAERERDVVIEIAATGAMSPIAAGVEQLGTALCASRIAQLGGALELEAARRNRRAVRLVLPRAVP